MAAAAVRTAAACHNVNSLCNDRLGLLLRACWSSWAAAVGRRAARATAVGSVRHWLGDRHLVLRSLMHWSRFALERRAALSKQRLERTERRVHAMQLGIQMTAAAQVGATPTGRHMSGGAGGRPGIRAGLAAGITAVPDSATLAAFMDKLVVADWAVFARRVAAAGLAMCTARLHRLQPPNLLHAACLLSPQEVW